MGTHLSLAASSRLCSHWLMSGLLDLLAGAPRVWECRRLASGGCLCPVGFPLLPLPRASIPELSAHLRAVLPVVLKPSCQ